MSSRELSSLLCQNCGFLLLFFPFFFLCFLFFFWAVNYGLSVCETLQYNSGIVVLFNGVINMLIPASETWACVLSLQRIPPISFFAQSVEMFVSSVSAVQDAFESPQPHLGS